MVYSMSLSRSALSFLALNTLIALFPAVAFNAETVDRKYVSCQVKFTTRVEQIQSKSFWSPEKRTVIVEAQDNWCAIPSWTVELVEKGTFGCETITELRYGISLELVRLSRDEVEVKLFAIGRELPFGVDWKIENYLRSTQVQYVNVEPKFEMIADAEILIGEQWLSRKLRQLTTITQLKASCEFKDLIN